MELCLNPSQHGEIRMQSPSRSMQGISAWKWIDHHYNTLDSNHVNIGSQGQVPREVPAMFSSVTPLDLIDAVFHS
jgi:hypothetical protein